MRLRASAVERGGTYVTYEGEHDPWGEATELFEQRKADIASRVGDLLLGFIYGTHEDDLGIPSEVRAIFVGVEVADLDYVPEGMCAARFSGSKYVIVECRSDNPNESAMAVGPAIDQLHRWIPENGYRQGDACFTASHENAPKPPFVDCVYIKLEPQS